MKIGWIGFGPKGIELVNGLIYFGHEVFGYNRTFSKMCTAIEKGMIPCNSLEELLEKVDIIFTVLTDSNSVYELYCEKNGILPTLKTLNKKITCIDMTTSSAKLAKFLANNDVEVEFLDAPFLIKKDHNKKSPFYFVVGGKKHIYDKYKNLFNCFDADVEYVGEIGSGQIVKKAYQMSIFSSCLGMSEAIEYAAGKNLDLTKLVDSISSGAATSYVSTHYFNAMINGNYDLDISLMQAKASVESILKENPYGSLYLSKILYGILKQSEDKQKSILAINEFYRGNGNERK